MTRELLTDPCPEDLAYLRLCVYASANEQIHTADPEYHKMVTAYMGRIVTLVKSKDYAKANQPERSADPHSAEGADEFWSFTLDC